MHKATTCKRIAASVGIFHLSIAIKEDEGNDRVNTTTHAACIAQCSYSYGDEKQYVNILTASIVIFSRLRNQINKRISSEKTTTYTACRRERKGRLLFVYSPRLTEFITSERERADSICLRAKLSFYSRLGFGRLALDAFTTADYFKPVHISLKKN